MEERHLDHERLSEGETDRVKIKLSVRIKIKKIKNHIKNLLEFIGIYWNLLDVLIK